MSPTLNFEWLFPAGVSTSHVKLQVGIEGRAGPVASSLFLFWCRVPASLVLTSLIN